MEYAINGFPHTILMFFLFTPFEPPLAGIMHNVLISKVIYSRLTGAPEIKLVGKLFEDPQRGSSQKRCYFFSCIASSINQVFVILLLVPLAADGAFNFLFIIVHINYVMASFALILAGTNIYHRNTQVCRLPDTYTRIADKAPRIIQESEKIKWLEPFQEMDVGNFMLFPECPDACRGAVCTGINIRPEPDCGFI